MKNYNYPIDYNMFDVEEITTIIKLLSSIEEINEGQKIENLDKIYNDYRRVLNSKIIEKEIDKDFEKISGYSIYKTMKRYKDDN